jgi:hypothetical protein
MAAPQDLAVASRRNRWHQSTLSALLDGCSWQYFLTYIAGVDQGLKPHASVGTAYHSAIEEAERRRMLKQPEMTAKEILSLAREELAKVTDDPELHERVTACVANFDRHIRPYLADHEPLALEPEFTVDLVEGAMPIGGYIDGVYRDGSTGTVFVIDHKTVGNFSRWRDGDGHRHQAAMYAVALVLSDQFPEVEQLPEMRYLLVRTSLGKRNNFEAHRVINVQPDLEDVRILGERIRLAEDRVARQAFTKNTDWTLCSEKWCPYYDRCVRGGDLGGTIESVLSGIAGSAADNQ